MDWAGKQHPVETLVDWCAPTAFAGAAGWSAWAAGLALPGVAAAVAAALVAAALVLRIAGRGADAALPAFDPVPIETDDAGQDELLLDDPLVEIDDDARVVRLFARQEPTPGELVLRIEDFLGDGARRPTTRPDIEPAAALPDAGAALHAALANIRASLR